MKLENKLATILGFAAKARQCTYGMTAVESGIKSGKVLVVLADEELSELAHRTIKSHCSYWEVPLIWISPPGKLGTACGKPQNKIVGITQNGFASRILEICEETEM